MMIKVCGMREADNIRSLQTLGIDLMGFIFWPKSSRYVSKRPAYLPQQAKRVGVFVDASVDEILQRVQDYSLDYIQLHGHETPEQISHLSPLTSHLSMIKAFNIATEQDILQTRPYEGLVDLFLFDTKGPSVGGNGEKFDWDVLSAYHGETPFLLSGGIGPDDAGRVKHFCHPKCVGIDLNSRFELAPGLKDVDALHRFMNELNR